MRILFVKYHGLGNDFAVVDARDGELEFAGALGRRLCDRHTGIGADGILLWRGSVDEPYMHVVNADGSVAEMCGNGLRCFVKYLLDFHAPRAAGVAVGTGGGTLTCAVERGADGKVRTVSARMGRASFAPGVIPIARAEPLVDAAIEVGGRALRFTAVNTGNPHAVTFEFLTESDRLALGPQVCALPLFPRQANVEFVKVLGPGEGGMPRLQVDVFERGCGWTQACGTGATAAVVVASHLGLVPVGREVAVHLPGGWLGVTVAADGVATMRGPAVEVYRGEVDLDAVAEPVSDGRAPERFGAGAMA